MRKSAHAKAQWQQGERLHRDSDSSYYEPQAWRAAPANNVWPRFIHLLNSIICRSSCPGPPLCPYIICSKRQCLNDRIAFHIPAVPRAAPESGLALFPIRHRGQTHRIAVLKIATCVIRNRKSLILLATGLYHFTMALKIANCVTPAPGTSRRTVPSSPRLVVRCFRKPAVV